MTYEGGWSLGTPFLVASSTCLPFPSNANLSPLLLCSLEEVSTVRLRLQQRPLETGHQCFH